MNKRRREILAALQPAVDFALKQAEAAPKLRTIPGFHLKARVSADAPAELMIYGPIGTSFFGDAISASDVAAALREAGAGPVNVRINSGGGDVFQGVAIHTLLTRHAGTVAVYVDGLAASAASFIMLAGDRVFSARNAMVMIHDGMTGTYGNADTHTRSAELLAKVSENIADMYAERAGEDAAHWRALMTVNAEDGTWYTGTEALAAGLVDEITEPADPDEEDAAVAARLSGHDRLPAKVQAFLEAHPEREAEPEAEARADENASPTVQDASYDDFRFAMQMAHWRMTNPASNGQSER